MSVFFVYLIKFSISLAAVYLFYRLVLRRLTFYNWNRWYLLGYTLLSFFIAAINITPLLQQNQLGDNRTIRLVPVLYLDTQHLKTSDSINYTSGHWTAWNWLIIILIAGTIILFLRLLVQYLSFLRIRSRAQLISGGGMRIYQVDGDIIPFSFGNSIFLNQQLHTEAELKEIIRHEFVHVKQRHSVDILWGEMLCIINWYNPFAWLLCHAMRQNLEFIADHKVISNGVDRKQYQYLLLKVIGNNHFSIASKFNFSSLKKRIAMMNKIKTARIHLVRFLFVLPLLAALLLSFRKQKGGDTLTRESKAVPRPAAFVTDTVPEVTEPNSKGFIINVKDNKGDCMLVIKDEAGKEVKKILLTEWKANAEKYEALYGEIPPPPPPQPAAPVIATPPAVPEPPEPVQLPDNVKKINIDNKKATVWLKNGQTETFDLSSPEQKANFEKKYGRIIPPPPPPKAISTSYNDVLNNTSSEYEITDKKAVITLKNGKVENYDLTNKDERAAFEKKYGEIINVNANVNSTVNTSVNANVNADVHTHVSTVITSDISPAIAPVVIKPAIKTTLSPNVSLKTNLTTVITPTVITTNVNGNNIIAPVALSPASLVTVVDDYGYAITGKEDIIITITKNTTRQELDKFITQMKEKGVDLDFDEIEYNGKGILVSISGTMKSGDSNSNFVANDFNKLILAMIKKGNRTYFKVSTKDNKEVI